MVGSASARHAWSISASRLSTPGRVWRVGAVTVAAVGVVALVVGVNVALIVGFMRWCLSCDG
jgi:hypothetical protein